MGPIPEVVVDDGVVFAGISFALVDGLAAINAVFEQPVKIAFVDQRFLRPTAGCVSTIRQDGSGRQKKPLGFSQGSVITSKPRAGREFGFSHGSKKQLFLRMWKAYKTQDM